MTNEPDRLARVEAAIAELVDVFGSHLVGNDLRLADLRQRAVLAVRAPSALAIFDELHPPAVAEEDKDGPFNIHDQKGWLYAFGGDAP